MSLHSLEPAAIARRAFDLAEEYRDVYGLPEQRARAAAIGCLSIEADELKRERIDSAPLNRHNYEHPFGGFASKGFTASAREPAQRGGRSTLPRWLIGLEEDRA